MSNDLCPKCGSPLSEIVETPTGKKLQRCSQGSWNKETRQAEGCDYVKWIVAEPQPLDEKCPKCDANLVFQVTRSGKKMKNVVPGDGIKKIKNQLVVIMLSG
jgi:hypothetical protein